MDLENRKMKKAKKKLINEGNVVYLNQPERDIPDYTGNREAAKVLVDRLLHYYHSRGYTWVKVWLEPEVQFSGRKFYNIRSNIAFDCNSI